MDPKRVLIVESDNAFALSLASIFREGGCSTALTQIARQLLHLDEPEFIESGVHEVSESGEVAPLADGAEPPAEGAAAEGSTSGANGADGQPQTPQEARDAALDQDIENALTGDG